MKIAICDDEQACIDRLCTLINAYCTGRRLTCDCITFTDPLAVAASELKSNDVVFLDANMGEALREVTKQPFLSISPALRLVSGSLYPLRLFCNLPFNQKNN